MQSTKTLTLRTPITMGAEEFTTLTLREPTAGEMEESQAPNVATSNIIMIALVANVPQPVIRKMAKTDFLEAVDYLSGFTWQPPKTGGTSSPK